MRIVKLPEDSLQNHVDTRNVHTVINGIGKYANLYEIEYKGDTYYEVVSNTTFEVIYRSLSMYFATIRFLETNQD